MLVRKIVWAASLICCSALLIAVASGVELAAEGPTTIGVREALVLVGKYLIEHDDNISARLSVLIHDLTNTDGIMIETLPKEVHRHPAREQLAEFARLLNEVHAKLNCSPEVQRWKDNVNIELRAAPKRASWKRVFEEMFDYYDRICSLSDK